MNSCTLAINFGGFKPEILEGHTILNSLAHIEKNHTTDPIHYNSIILKFFL